MDEAQKREMQEYIDAGMKSGKIAQKTAESAIAALSRAGRTISETGNRIAELGRRAKTESDARSILQREILQETQRIRNSGDTKAQQDERLIALQRNTIASMADADDAEKKRVEQLFKSSNAIVQSQERTKNFGDAITKTQSYLVPLGQAAGDVAKNLLRNIQGDPLGAQADIAKNFADKAGQGLSAAGQAAGSLGESLRKSNSTFGKLAGGGLQVLGIGAQGAAAATKLAGEAMAAITPIMVDYQKTFTNVNAAGATFGGGMTELRNLAGNAGVRMGDLAGGITQGQEAFERAGLNFQQASRFVSQFGKEVINGDKSLELFALGFTDVSSRIALQGAAIDAARAKGLTFAQIQGQVNELTLTYGKDLKVLQGIAGKNAEKELEKARLESQRGALMNQLTEDQKKAYEGAYTALAVLGPNADKARTALTQMAAGAAVTDPSILADKTIMAMIEQLNSKVQAGATDVKTGAAAAQSVIAETAEALRGPAGEFARTMDFAAVQLGTSAPGVVTGISSLSNSLMAYRASAEQGAQALADANKAPTDQITKQFAAMNQSATNAQVALEQVATQAGAVSKFKDAMDLANDAVMKLVKTINDFTGGTGGSVVSSIMDGLKSVLTEPGTWIAAAGLIGADVAKSIAGAIGRTPIGAAGSTVGGAIGGAVGGATGYLANKAGSVLGYAREALGMGVRGASSLAGTAAGATAATAAGAEAALATGGAKAMLKKLPLLGGLISGGLEYYDSGNLGRSIAKGTGTVIGGAIGGIAGTAVTPGAGSLVGAVGGGYFGEQMAEKLYDFIFGKKSTEQPAVPTAPRETGAQTPVSQAAPSVATEFAANIEEQRAEALARAIKSVQSADPEATKTVTRQEVMTASMTEMNDGIKQMVSRFDEMIDQLRDVSSNTRQTAIAIG